MPVRNALFLAYAMEQAEILDAQEIYLGANALDAPSYPDCILSYIQAFQQVLNVGTKQAAEGNSPQLLTPLIQWDKAEIIRQGIALDVPTHMTFSCYDLAPQQNPWGQCDACILRTYGFAAAVG
ncbi:hypothetical protein NEOC65_002117 [Neochlamydia sp. AcF65]|nr:hypothetical protein [Neochlamydia sp. AcF65]